jgi:hypothetical protein
MNALYLECTIRLPQPLYKSTGPKTLCACCYMTFISRILVTYEGSIPQGSISQVTHAPLGHTHAAPYGAPQQRRPVPDAR